MSGSDEPESDDGLITCWCGATGTYEELFSDSGLESTCGGSGHLNCDCGGDFCVCHWHGGTDCDGCEDCESDDDRFHEDYGGEEWEDDLGPGDRDYEPG